MIHVNWMYFGKKYDNPDGSILWAVEAIVNIITRFSVPCFVMMSGAFILPNFNNRKAKDFYRKTSYKIMLPAFIMTVGLIIAQVLLNAICGKNLLYGLDGLLTGNFYNLWYIIMLLGLYMITPFIIMLRENITWKTYKIISGVLLIWSIISQMTSIQMASYTIGVIGAYLAYYCLGDVIKQEIVRRDCKSTVFRRYTLAIISTIAITIAYIIRINGFYYYIENAYTNFFSPIVVIYSICVFTFFGTIKIKKSWVRLSETTFYVYLVHTLIMILIYQLIEKIQTKESISYIILCFGTIIASFIIGAAINKVWKSVSTYVELKPKWDNLHIWDICNGEE